MMTVLSKCKYSPVPYDLAKGWLVLVLDDCTIMIFRVNYARTLFGFIVVSRYERVLCI